MEIFKEQVIGWINFWEQTLEDVKAEMTTEVTVDECEKIIELLKYFYEDVKGDKNE